MHLPAEHPVDKEVPPINILHLIKKQILEVPIYLIEHFQHIIQLSGIQIAQTLIIKVYIREMYTCGLQGLKAKCRFSASTDSDHNLCMRALQINHGFFWTMTEILATQDFQFLHLIH